MIALVFATADRCAVFLFDTPAACMFVAMQIAHMGAVFCVPAGVAS